MNANESRKFEKLLHKQLHDLEAENALGSESQQTVELDQQAVGRLSRMDALQNQAMAKAGQARRDQQRMRIIAAITRLEKGEYGYCTDCGEDIDPKRLTIDPTVPKCLSCASG